MTRRIPIIFVLAAALLVDPSVLEAKSPTAPDDIRPKVAAASKKPSSKVKKSSKSSLDQSKSKSKVKKKKVRKRRVRRKPKPTPKPKRWAVGLGYPDLRLRYSAIESLDVEAKFAFLPGIQVYTARMYWNFWDLGPLNVVVAAEGGYGHFEGIEQLTGNAWIGGAALGLEYPFAKVMSLSVDFGPAYIAARAAEVDISSVDLIANTALYYRF